MKWQALSLSLLAATATAASVPTTIPVLCAPPKPPSTGLTVYALRLSTYDTSLNGQYLQLYNNTVGVYNESSAQLQVYPSKIDNKNSSLVELHTYPIGIIDHVLAMLGSQSEGVFGIRDVTMPAATEVTAGTTFDWTSFNLPTNTTTADSPVNAFTWAGGAKDGRWAAFPKLGGWNIVWKNPSAITTQDYVLVNINYVPLSAA
ncbi:hypothetical protein GQ53DRAFT_841984 [Thozetella sp. PMI_491]|nr:hypothetical protein GQ53DRAFT_841984 [Thozetella sp. PMI_491]